MLVAISTVGFSASHAIVRWVTAEQHLKLRPSEYFARQGWAAVAADEDFVSHVVEAIGDDRLVTTSDYPHGDAKYPHGIDTFMELPLSDRGKKKILWDNPARLYGL